MVTSITSPEVRRTHASLKFKEPKAIDPGLI
jgi:hypothetical protein